MLKKQYSNPQPKAEFHIPSEVKRGLRQGRSAFPTNCYHTDLTVIQCEFRYLSTYHCLTNLFNSDIVGITLPHFSELLDTQVILVATWKPYHQQIVSCKYYIDFIMICSNRRVEDVMNCCFIASSCLKVFVKNLQLYIIVENNLQLFI